LISEIQRYFYINR